MTMGKGRQEPEPKVWQHELRSHSEEVRKQADADLAGDVGLGDWASDSIGDACDTLYNVIKDTGSDEYQLCLRNAAIVLEMVARVWEGFASVKVDRRQDLYEHLLKVVEREIENVDSGNHDKNVAPDAVEYFATDIAKKIRAIEESDGEATDAMYALESRAVFFTSFAIKAANNIDLHGTATLPVEAPAEELMARAEEVLQEAEREAQSSIDTFDHPLYNLIAYTVGELAPQASLGAMVASQETSNPGQRAEQLIELRKLWLDYLKLLIVALIEIVKTTPEGERKSDYPSAIERTAKAAATALQHQLKGDQIKRFNQQGAWDWEVTRCISIVATMFEAFHTMEPKDLNFAADTIEQSLPKAVLSVLALDHSLGNK